MSMNRPELSELFNKLDSTTYNHSIRVMKIAAEIESFYGIEDDSLSIAALLHDIGKIYVSHKVLDKVAPLSSLEREIVSLHPYYGYQILKNYDIDEEICRLVLYHHGLKPICISPIEPYYTDKIKDRSKLLHSIDSFEALTSDRPYHRGYTSQEALNIMLGESGHHKIFIDYLQFLIKSKSKDTETAIFRGNHCVDDEKADSILYNLSPSMIMFGVG